MMPANQKKYLALTAIGAVALAGVMAAIPNGVTSGLSGGVDALSLLKSRSPGERAAGAETSKRPMATLASAPAKKPISRVLSAAPPPVAAPMAAPPPVALAAPAAAAPVAAFAPAPVVAAAPVAGGGFPIGALALLPIIPAIVDGGGGGGGGGGTFNPPAPAIPEPATWLMMITGFGILGFALRRRRKLIANGSRGSRRGSEAAAPLGAY